MAFLFSQQRRLYSSSTVTALAAGFTFFIGAFSMVSWIADVPLWRSFIPGYPDVKTNLAIGLMVAGLALWLIGFDGRRRAVRWGRALASLMILLGLVTLVEYLFDFDFGIDQALYIENGDVAGTLNPNRMAVWTAVDFVLMGWALLCLDRPSRGSLTRAQTLAMLGAVPCLISLLSYAYGVRDAREYGHFLIINMISVPAALAWLFFAIGITFARSNVGLMRTLGQSTFAAYSTRRMLWPAITIPPILGAIFYFDIEYQYFVPGVGAAVIVVLSIIAFTAFAWSNAKGLESLEMKRRIAEWGRKRSEADFESMFSLAPTGMAQSDPRTGRFLRVNRRFCEMTGYSQSELLNMSFRELTVTEDDEVLWPIFQELIRQPDQEFSFEKRYMRKDGTRFWVKINGVVLTDEEGKAQRTFAIVEDATQRKEWEEALKKARDLAESANRMKSMFLATMSHELRTPLTAITGFAELLLNNKLPGEERQHFAATICRNGQVLVHLIDEILDISKVESGKLEFEIMPFSLSDLLGEVINMLQPLAQEKGIELNLEYEGPIPDKIESDPTRLRQILINIIGNAVKFTQTGRVTVRVNLEASNGEGRLNFSVQDTGPGISDDQVPRLFQTFSQADTSTTRCYGGSGLGLALSKRLAQALGGDVNLVSSTPGQGSIFTVTIPTGSLKDMTYTTQFRRVAASPGIETWIADERLKNCRILLVEDSPENQLLIKKILGRHGAHVEVANNGKDGVRMALSNGYDLVLMDIQMPEMDGYQATRRLRNSSYSQPIIALTAHAMKEERDQCLSAGCDDHLTKPIDCAHLIEVVARHLGRQCDHSNAVAAGH